MSNENSNGPGALKKISMFAATAAAVAASGFSTVSEETYEKRLEFCRTCPSLENGTCKECGCPMARAALFTKKVCPLKKW